MQIGNATVLHIDCLEYMATLPDKAFDLAIVDPPYGIDRFKKAGSVMMNYSKMSSWDKKPTQEYFSELFRVSLNQIIWGGNYFSLPPSNNFIFWHKLDVAPSFARGELAWSSFDKPACYWASAIEKEKIHPTQKPFKLYEYLLGNYAKPGQRILDTHLGSGSSAIACNNLGFEMVGCELDYDYYTAACKRIEHHNKQLRLFA